MFKSFDSTKDAAGLGFITYPSIGPYATVSPFYGLSDELCVLPFLRLLFFPEDAFVISAFLSFRD